MPNDKEQEIEANISNSTDNEKSKNGNFFEKILEIITGVGSEERIKLKKLKDISKELNFLKYKFYNFKKDNIQPAFGEYFYEIYRMSQNFTRFFDIKNHNNTIKQFLFEFIISKKQLEIKQKLEKDKIEQLLKESKDQKAAFEQI
ncbi:MAG TPA: hypothetical protein PLO89_05995, partial [Spirochaetota bacterium]|nr:hypothetical protein [Spirochaetota bacterium]